MTTAGVIVVIVAGDSDRLLWPEYRGKSIARLISRASDKSILVSRHCCSRNRLNCE